MHKIKQGIQEESACVRVREEEEGEEEEGGGGGGVPIRLQWVRQIADTELKGICGVLAHADGLQRNESVSKPVPRK